MHVLFLMYIIFSIDSLCMFVSFICFFISFIIVYIFVKVPARIAIVKNAHARGNITIYSWQIYVRLVAILCIH